MRACAEPCCADSPDLPTFAMSCRSDSPNSPTFAKMCRADSPDSPTLAKGLFWEKCDSPQHICRSNSPFSRIWGERPLLKWFSNGNPRNPCGPWRLPRVPQDLKYFCGLYCKQVVHSYLSAKFHFFVINIPNVHSHGKISVITENWLWGYKIKLIFSINYGHFFTAKKWAWNITDICLWPRTNDSECVFNTGHWSHDKSKLRKLVLHNWKLANKDDPQMLSITALSMISFCKGVRVSFWGRVSANYLRCK